MPLEPREIDALEDIIRFESDAVDYVRGLDFNAFVAKKIMEMDTRFSLVAERLKKNNGNGHPFFSCRRAPEHASLY